MQCVVRWVLAALLCGGLMSCGLDPRSAPAAASDGDAAVTGAAFARQLALAAPSSAPGAGDSAALPVDPGPVLDWAQSKYPDLFPAGPASMSLRHEGVDYMVRSYRTGNHLGITKSGEVWGLGPFTGQVLSYLGRVSEFTPLMQAERCSLPAANCSATDRTLRSLLAASGLGGDPAAGRVLPSIDDPLPQLGKLLFFSKALSVDLDTACASCHHPMLGGADGLALPIGTGAASPDLLGPGRVRVDGTLRVGRNANTIFNTGLFDRALFWDGRVESLNPQPRTGGSGSAIRTPASPFGAADPLAGPNLLAAQARFPVVVAPEMRGDNASNRSDDALRSHLASRLGDHGDGLGALPPSRWLEHFRRAFGRPDGSAAELITFDHIMRAIAEYQRSATFVQNPWRRYVQGDNAAISQAAKLGAIVFFRGVEAGGAACVQCHKGDFFTDERFHPVGFPQVGPGKDAPGRDDLGRQDASGVGADAGAFRTPSLLNIELSAPYGHAGTYATLEQVVDHYVFPHDTVRAFVAGQQWCRIEPFASDPGCRSDTLDVDRNSRLSLARMDARRIQQPSEAMPLVDPTRGSPQDTPNVAAFLRSLTDPCLKDRSCLARWIPRPDEAPDALQLNAVDRNGALR